MLVFDLTDRHSFDNMSMWMEEFFNYADIEEAQKTSFPLVLIGNKVDVEGRQVDSAEAEAFCAQHNDMQYYETSAKTAVNVETAFYTVARLLVERQRDSARQMKYETVDLSSKGSSGGCC
jgi:Ras-related protein Rab-9A/Ras-related protein Rab-9B